MPLNSPNDAARPLIERLLSEGEPILEHYGYPAIVVCNFAESLGVPLPGQTTLVAGAMLADRGDFNIALVIALAFLSVVSGGAAGYWVGRVGGRRLLERLPIRPDRLERVEDFFVRQGLILVFSARFLDGLRQLVPMVSGSMNMPWWRFFAAHVAGSVIWVAVWGVAVYVFGRHIHALLPTLHRLEPHGWWLAGGGLCALLIWLLARRQTPGK